MNLKLLSITALLASSFPLFCLGQKNFATIAEVTGYKGQKIENIIPIIGENGHQTILIDGKKSISIFQIDSNFKVVKKLENLTLSLYNEDPTREKLQILGGIDHGNDTYDIVFSNEDRKIFFQWQLDFNAATNSPVRVVFLDTLSIDLKNKQFIEYYTFENKMYFLTMDKKSTSDIMYVSELVNGETFIKYPVPIKYDKEETSLLRPLFSSFFRKNNGSASKGKAENINKINNDILNSIGNTHFSNKIYYKRDTIYISYDNSSTHIWTLDLKNKIGSFRRYSLNNSSVDQNGIQNFDPLVPMPYAKIKENGKYSSFIDLKNKRIYLGNLQSHLFILQVQKLNTDSILISYRMNADSDIQWKNSDIIQNTSRTTTLTGTINTKKILTKTSQLIHEMKYGDIGIVLKPYSDLTQEIVISSSEALPSGGGGGFTMGGAGGVGMSFTPVFTNYSNPENVRISYFKSLLDEKSLNHMVGEMAPSVSEQIKTFEDNAENKIKSKTIYRYKNYFIYGYFDSKNKTYKLLKFM